MKKVQISFPTLRNAFRQRTIRHRRKPGFDEGTGLGENLLHGVRLADHRYYDILFAMTNPRPSHAFEGFAVVSADGFIADAEGVMPDRLKFDADWDYFQAALDRADITLIGRHTHEAAPNLRKRHRLVFSNRVDGVVKEDETTLWIDPTKADPNAVIGEISGAGSHVAVVGGQGVFDWVLSNPGFSAFHLSLAHHVRLGRGQKIFADGPDLDAAVALLEDHGLALSYRAWFDRAAGLELFVYNRG